MHNNMPLTKEHQMELGKCENKPTPGNPKGYSKRQLTVLNFFRDRDSRNKIRNIYDDGNFSSWGESQTPSGIMKMLHTRKVWHLICSSHRIRGRILPPGKNQQLMKFWIPH